ncbi:MAG TPA: hypothetical protein VF783_18255 [Terriglobales bacterium]
MTLQQLIDFATDGRDEDDPDRNVELQFEIKLSHDVRGEPYKLEVESVDYVARTITLY